MRPRLHVESLEPREMPSGVPLAFTIVNNTGLGTGTPLFVSIYGKENGIWGSFDITGAFSKFDNADKTVAAQRITGSTQKITFPNLPNARIDSARMVFGIGTAPVLTVNANNGGVNAPNLGNPSDPNARRYFDFVEFTERAADGALFINTSTIDQVGVPLTVNVKAAPPAAPSTTVGVSVDRAGLFSRYQTFINGIAASNSAARAFLDLTSPNLIPSGTLNGRTQPYRIVSPKDLVQFAQNLRGQAYSSPLKTYFNAPLTSLFASTQPISLRVPNPNFGNTAPNPVNPGDGGNYVFNGVSTTVTAMGNDNQNHVYRALKFTGTVAGKSVSLIVYRPLFSTNGSGSSQPLAPKWITNPAESPGQMVLGCDGVFADNLGQFPGSDPNNSISSLANLKSNLLANIENQLVSAINRGVSALPVSQWQTPSKYYAPTSRANFYSAFLHSDVSIDRKAYGFPYDDQAGQSSEISAANPQSITVTLGAWIKASRPPTALLVGGHPDGRSVLFSPDADSGQYAATTMFDAVQGIVGHVRVALGDVTGDGVPDRITGAGPSGSPLVVVTDGASGAEVTRFNAFEPTFTGGVHLAAADINADGFTDVIVTPDRGGGPVVAHFDGAKLAAGGGADAITARYFGIEDVSFRGGARAAVGDINGDGTPDILVAAGTGGGPRVAGFDGTSVATSPVKLFADFFAFEPTLPHGVYVAVGDVNEDGLADLVFGGGPGAGPRVRVADAGTLLRNGEPTTLADFFAGDPTSRAGVRVTTRVFDGDEAEDILTGSGEGESSRVGVYSGAELQSHPVDPTSIQSFDPFAAELADGVFVG